MNAGERQKIDNWRSRRDSNPRRVLPLTRFPGVRLKPLIHRSSQRAPLYQREGARRAHGLAIAPQPGHCTFWVWIIFMAEVIKAETSVMLLGTISVVLASAATLL